MSAKKDPELVRQLESAPAGECVVAVCQLAVAAGTGEQTAKAVRALVERVSGKVGVKPDRVKVFENLSSFALSASPAFLKELLRQKEVAGATASEQPEDALIRPVKEQRK